MYLKLEGKLNSDYVDIYVGGESLIHAIHKVDWDKEITVALLSGKCWTAFKGGDIYAYEGYPGYSEWTPGESVSIEIGGKEIAYMLRNWESEEVIVVVSDEPVDLGELMDDGND